MKIGYTVEGTDERLVEGLAELAADYPLVQAPGGDLRVAFSPIPDAKCRYRIRPDGDGLVIEYSDRAAALRGVGSLLSGIGHDAEFEEASDFRTFGIMLDCSRNAVMKVEHFKGWLRRLALLGYNMAMLYTEDTYALEAEPFFGYQRGAYTTDELMEIDAYARKFDIEMIPCLQTLGHLAQILKWRAYAGVKDTQSVLLADEEQSYLLLEKMIRHWSEVFASTRIHVGMDEAHDLGRGAYLDKFGYRNGFDIFNEHLARVVAICEKYGLKPMIWSDMYFRLGSRTGDYYDKDAVIPAEVAEHIPKPVDLVYWDYYHKEEEFYTDWIERHRALGFDPIMGSGVWTWSAAWHATNYTEPKAGACVRACKKAGVKEIFFTMWGDDGALCDFDSAMEGLTYVAELAYAGTIDETAISSRFRGICRGDYQASRLAGHLSLLDTSDDQRGGTSEVWLWPALWDDPLLGIFWNDMKARQPDAWDKALAHYRKLAAELRDMAELQQDTTAGDLRHAWLLSHVMARKVEIRDRLVKAYATRDTAALEKTAEMIPGQIAALRDLDASYRQQWMKRNKPFGLEIVQIRIAGLIRRFEELSERIRALCAGDVDTIDELEYVPDEPAYVRASYRTVATACSPGP